MNKTLPHPGERPAGGGIRVVGVGFGAPAREAITDFVTLCKVGDPLAPVTLVVPSNYTGLALRRAFGATGNGVAALETLTISELADRLAGPSLQTGGRRPLSDMGVTAAVRHALASDPGLFEPVASHHQAATALGRTYRELRDLSAAQLDKVANASARAASVVEICRRVRGSLRRQWYDECDLMAAATERLRASALPPEFGNVAVCLPRRLNQHESRLLRTLGDGPGEGGVEVILGVTGDDSADSSARAICRRLRVPPPSATGDGPRADAKPAVGTAGAEELSASGVDAGGTHGSAPGTAAPPTGTHIVVVTDADEEARTVVRAVMADLDQGVPPGRIAVFFAAAEPYGRTLEEQFGAAGITTYGNTARTLAESIYGRFTLGVAELADAHLGEPRMERRDVFDLLAGARIARRGLGERRDGDNEPESMFVPDSAWERLARSAHVVSGDDWSARLARHAGELREHCRQERAGEDPSSSRLRRLEREAAECSGLSEFVAELRDRLTEGRSRRAWRSLCEWMRGSLHRYLGAVGHAPWTSQWPAWEQTAAERVERVLDRLADLGDIEPQVSFATMHQALNAELAQPHGRSGTEGTGVYVGPLAGAADLLTDRTYIVGLAEGIYPARPQPDSLVNEHERQALGDALGGQADAIADQHRTLLAAIAGARDACTLLTPRGNLRQNADHVPSRWLLETARRLDHARTYFTKGYLDSGNLHEAALDAGVPFITERPSFLGAVRSATFPAADWEYDAASLLATSTAEVRRKRHPMFSDPAFRTGVELSAARDSRVFTRFDGNVSHVIDRASALADVLSATRLETWAACPRAYLFQQLLGVDVVIEPEQILRLSALERGSLVHQAIDGFYRPLLDARDTWTSNEPMPAAGPHRSPPGPQRPPSDEDRAELVRIGRQLADQAEQRGVTGHQLLWERDRASLLGDLDELLDRDHQRDPAMRGEIQSSEFRFGFNDSADAVAFATRDGSVVHFRGAIDRVERTDDGRLVVIDYKTGSADSFTAIANGDQADPTMRGTKLQLPVYALAAAQHFGGRGIVGASASGHGTVAHDSSGASGAGAIAAYWFVSSGKGRWAWLPLRIDDRLMEQFSEVVSAIAAGIEGGVFPGYARVGDDRRHYRVCPYCDPDGQGTVDVQRLWRLKRDDPALALFADLADPVEASP